MWLLVLIPLTSMPLATPGATFQEFTSQERCEAVADAIVLSRMPSQGDEDYLRKSAEAIRKTVFCKPK